MALLFTPTVGYQSDEDRKEKTMKRKRSVEGEDGEGGRVKGCQPVSSAEKITIRQQ